MADLETADGVTIVRFDNAPVNALDAGTTADADVRASWISEETRGRIAGFLGSLARGR